MKRYFFAVLCGTGILMFTGCGSMESGKENQQTYAVQEAGQGEDRKEKGSEEVGKSSLETGAEPEETKIKSERTEIKSETKAEKTEGREESEKPAKPDGPESDGLEAVQPEFDPASFYGTWKGKAYLTCRVSALSSQEIEDYMKDSLTYGEESFARNGAVEETENFGYEFTAGSVRELEEDFQADLSSWADEKTGIMGGNLSELNDCFGKYFYVIDPDCLWVYYEGVFFRMERIEN